MEAAVGRRMLGEVEEASLDEILSSLRASLDAATASKSAAEDAHNAAIESPVLKKATRFSIPALDDLVARHFRATQSPVLSVSGRHLPLLYKLIATLVAEPLRKAVVVIDLEHRFDVSRVLQCSPFQESPPTPRAEQAADQAADTTDAGQEHSSLPRLQVTIADLAHVHIYRPTRGPQTRISDLVAMAEQHMLYKDHGSRDREWWGTVLIGRGGPSGPGVDVTVAAGWRGWLQVAAYEPASFGSCLSLEEAVQERERRQRRGGESQTWVASSVWGSFEFAE